MNQSQILHCKTAQVVGAQTEMEKGRNRTMDEKVECIRCRMEMEPGYIADTADTHNRNGVRASRRKVSGAGSAWTVSSQSQ